jgi:putative photosynthetic complex assembly protein 2
MLSYWVPVGYALFLWWFSTGVILYLDKRPSSTYRWSLLGASLVALVSLSALVFVRDSASVVGAYVGFTAGVLIWGWMEISYFMGFVTGPRKAPCPPGCGSWRRFWLAIQTSLYHELAIVAAAGLMFWLTRDGVNQVGIWTYTVLWWMRWSAKLNLFFGVPNLNEEWLPEHIRFLTSYLSKRPMNLFFPVSVNVATVVMCLLVVSALDLSTASFAGVALMLAATLLALAILEHWLLVLPLADAALWNWALDAPDRAQLTGGAEKAADPVTLRCGVAGDPYDETSA